MGESEQTVKVKGCESYPLVSRFCDFHLSTPSPPEFVFPYPEDDGGV